MSPFKTNHLIQLIYNAAAIPFIICVLLLDFLNIESKITYNLSFFAILVIALLVQIFIIPLRKR